ncbi:hypothetical protein F1542_13680 [Komagataeibacter sp. FXV3]|nr:hypothetical protein [Komagataeibacter sp. FXV3]
MRECVKTLPRQPLANYQTFLVKLFSGSFKKNAAFFGKRRHPKTFILFRNVRSPAVRPAPPRGQAEYGRIPWPASRCAP